MANNSYPRIEDSSNGAFSSNPQIGVSIVDSSDDRECDFEVLSLNLAEADATVAEKVTQCDSGVLKQDCMWNKHEEEGIKRHENTDCSLEMLLRIRALLTPLIFELRTTATVRDNIDDKGTLLSETTSNQADLSSVDNGFWHEDSFLLSPAETESDEEIDVVGSGSKTPKQSETNVLCSPPKLSSQLLNQRLTPDKSSNRWQLNSQSLIVPQRDVAVVRNLNKVGSGYILSVVDYNQNRVDKDPLSACPSGEGISTPLTGNLLEANTIAPLKSNLTVKRSSKHQSRYKSVGASYYESDGSSSSDSLSKPCRRAHNHLERRRRDELKKRFDDLRMIIPDLVHDDRAARVRILKKASELICHMETQEAQLVAEKVKLKSRNDELLRQLVHLVKLSK